MYKTEIYRGWTAFAILAMVYLEIPETTNAGDIDNVSFGEGKMGGCLLAQLQCALQIYLTTMQWWSPHHEKIKFEYEKLPEKHSWIIFMNIKGQLFHLLPNYSISYPQCVIYETVHLTAVLYNITLDSERNYRCTACFAFDKYQESFWPACSCPHLPW